MAELEMVTITGADDQTNIADLVRLSEEFPFVEWGILIGSHEGKPRFPSCEWIRELTEARLRQISGLNLSLHICGRELRNIASGRLTLEDRLDYRVGAFSRCQLNWHGERQGILAGENVLRAFGNQGFWEPTIIFQLDAVNDALCEPAQRRFRCAGLFDRSHGAGVLPGEWPQARTDMQCGWAGGLGPHNLADELPKIHSKAWPVASYWIDMETQVRTDERLDIQKVEAALKIAAEFRASSK